jgi:enterochelin esterase-like enzyme
MHKVSYPVYYYTDETGGVNSDPRGLVLERRDQPITKPANIYLPYNYSEAVQYPIIFILHGITDNEDTWVGSRSDPRPKVMLDALIDAGEIRPLIAVFPNACSSSNFANCGFDNQAGYYYFANELVNDLIPFMESEYSVTASRNCRALSGFSMGGMQTVNTGMCQSLEHFASFAAFAAAPSTYNSDQIAEYLTWENEQASYLINFFYNTHGDNDGTAESSHMAAVNGLTDKSEYLTNENFAYHTVPGGHDYPQAMIGLYNFLRIVFPAKP